MAKDLFNYLFSSYFQSFSDLIFFIRIGVISSIISILPAALYGVLFYNYPSRISKNYIGWLGVCVGTGGCVLLGTSNSAGLPAFLFMIAAFIAGGFLPGFAWKSKGLIVPPLLAAIAAVFAITNPRQSYFGNALIPISFIVVFSMAMTAAVMAILIGRRKGHPREI
jgi:hypothetical protein